MGEGDLPCGHFISGPGENDVFTGAFSCCGNSRSRRASGACPESEWRPNADLRCRWPCLSQCCKGQFANAAPARSMPASPIKGRRRFEPATRHGFASGGRQGASLMRCLGNQIAHETARMVALRHALWLPERSVNSPAQGGALGNRDAAIHPALKGRNSVWAHPSPRGASSSGALSGRDGFWGSSPRGVAPGLVEGMRLQARIDSCHAWTPECAFPLLENWIQGFRGNARVRRFPAAEDARRVHRSFGVSETCDVPRCRVGTEVASGSARL